MVGGIPAPAPAPIQPKLCVKAQDKTAWLALGGAAVSLTK